MSIWELALAIGFILAFGLGFIWLATRLGRITGTSKALTSSFEKAAEDDVERIFNKDFREELRNRGRLHFEKILGENAMFLQQDLRLTTSQLNEYMKGEISRDLKDAFANYQSAITDAKQLAVESIEKTKNAIDDERKTLIGQLEKEVEEEKARRIQLFDARMAEIVNHYVLQAVGDQIDLSDQLEYILAELEANKQAILEDIKSGT